MREQVSVDTIMSRNPVRIESTATVDETIKEMKTKNVGKIVVTVDGRPRAIIEEWRLFTIDPTMRISDIIDRFPPITTIPRGTSIDEAKRLLTDKPALVVTGEKETDMLGILTIEDFVGWLKKAL